jgi:hypothetical protein
VQLPSGIHTSRIGARLGAAIGARAIAKRLEAGAAPGAIWLGVRAELVDAPSELAARLGGEPERERTIREHLLFTIVAAAATPDQRVQQALTVLEQPMQRRRRHRGLRR